MLFQLSAELFQDTVDETMRYIQSFVGADHRSFCADDSAEAEGRRHFLKACVWGGESYEASKTERYSRTFD